jgi:hypothetical protein
LARKWFSGLGDMNKFNLLNRLQISDDGKIVVDGQPQMGGGNSEMTFAIKDSWSGSSNITKTFTSSMYGFDITNDGSSDLTFTINGLTITVKSGEVFSDVFEAFTSVTITTTVSYRATVKESLSGTLSPSPSPSGDTTAPVISISPTSGTYTSSQQITLSSNETATIYYTTNGTTPTASSTTYSAPFTVSATSTVKYFGIDSAGNQSTVQSVIYTINVPDTTPPSPVTNLAVGTVTTISIPVTWTKSSSTDVVNYEVAYSTNGTNFTVASNAINASSTSYTVNGLTSNTSYTIRVVAIDSSGNRSTPVTVSASTVIPTDTTPPVDVTNLTTSNVTDTSLTLSWTASASTDIASYDVYKGLTLLGNTTSTTYNVNSLIASTSYTFKVISKDTSGNASTGVSITSSTIASAPANDTTPPTITASPVGGTYTSTQSVTLASNETATIYYTTDGTTPTTSSTVYSSMISISSNTTLKYFGVDSANNQSTVQTQTYTISALVEGTHYLKLNGTSDSVVLAGILNYDEIEMSTNISSTDTDGYIIDGRAATNGISIYFTNGFTPQGISSIKNNNVSITVDSTAYSNITKDQKINLIINFNLVVLSSNTVTLFKRNGQNSQWQQADLYYVKLYKAGTLVAYYDLTNQSSGTTVVDVSGNGNPSMQLNGGTWV